MKIKGVILKSGKIAYYLEPKGKDASFKRWRITAYYEPNLAETLFFDCEQEYNSFLTTHKHNTFKSYEEYKLANLN